MPVKQMLQAGAPYDRISKYVDELAKCVAYVRRDTIFEHPFPQAYLVTRSEQFMKPGAWPKDQYWLKREGYEAELISSAGFKKRLIEWGLTVESYMEAFRANPGCAAKGGVNGDQIWLEPRDDKGPRDAYVLPVYELETDTWFDLDTRTLVQYIPLHGVRKISRPWKVGT